jgi:hypothetical protein
MVGARAATLGDRAATLSLSAVVIGIESFYPIREHGTTPSTRKESQEPCRCIHAMRESERAIVHHSEQEGSRAKARVVASVDGGLLVLASLSRFVLFGWRRRRGLILVRHFKPPCACQQP